MRFAVQCGKFIALQSRVRYIIVLAKGKTRVSVEFQHNAQNMKQENY